MGFYLSFLFIDRVLLILEYYRKTTTKMLTLLILFTYVQFSYSKALNSRLGGIKSQSKGFYFWFSVVNSRG